MTTRGVKKKVSWREPAWSYRPALRKEGIALARGIPVVLGITAAGILLLFWLCNRYVPNLQFNWLEALGGSIAAVTVFLGLEFTALWFIPPRVSISANWVRFSRGSSVVVWRLDGIHSAHIDEAGAGRLTLVVQTVAGRERRCGISSHVSLEELREMFGAKWNAAPLPPDMEKEELAAVLRPRIMAIGALAGALPLALLVSAIMGASHAAAELIMWAGGAAMGALIVETLVKIRKHERAHRSARKAVGRPEK